MDTERLLGDLSPPAPSAVTTPTDMLLCVNAALRALLLHVHSEGPDDVVVHGVQSALVQLESVFTHAFMTWVVVQGPAWHSAVTKLHWSARLEGSLFRQVVATAEAQVAAATTVTSTRTSDAVQVLLESISTASTDFLTLALVATAPNTRAAALALTAAMDGTAALDGTARR